MIAQLNRILRLVAARVNLGCPANSVFLGRGRVLSSVLAIWMAAVLAVSAAPVAPEKAAVAVRGWLKAEVQPLGEAASQKVGAVQTFRNSAGLPLYHVVALEPAGFVIVAADDALEPIIAFSPLGQFDASPSNPLGALVSQDLPQRLANVRASSGASRFSAKWNRLNAAGGMARASVVTSASSVVSDVRVAPLLSTRWGQATAYEARQLACYNYFTPPYPAGTVSNYAAGCVATAMAQLMRYWQYPTAGVGTNAFNIEVNGVPQARALRGGDGLGGAYDWASMPEMMGFTPALAQRQAIGALTHDAGVAAHMAYTADASGAYPDAAKNALLNVFQYSRAICGIPNSGASLMTGIEAMVNANLDAGCPVLLGISGLAGGHSIVCDGYGYSLATLYHHLNLGWNGLNDAWYALPTVNTAGGYSFTAVNSCIYNVFPSGAGEIISGRVLGPSGTALAGATVTATITDGEAYATTANAQGIYAFAGVPSATRFTITVDAAGYARQTAVCATGTSVDGQVLSGNCWGLDFVLGAASVTGVDHFAWSPIAAQTVGAPFAATLTAQDASGATVDGFSGTVSLSAVSQTAGLTLNPSVTAHFTNGVWTGALTVGQTAEAVTLLACDADGHQGTSATFPVTVVVEMAELTVLASPADGGTVTGGGTFEVGSEHVIAATANPGWGFSRWQDGNTENPRAIVLAADGATYTATFTNQNVPVITAQPQSETVLVGETATLSVSVANEAGTPYAFYWYKQGAMVKSSIGTTSSTFRIAKSQEANSGAYYVKVCNLQAGTSTQSDAATLKVVTTLQPGTDTTSASVPCTLGVPKALPNGQVELTISGAQNTAYEIQASGDLKNWATVNTVTLSATSQTITLAAPGSASFYRAHRVP